MPSDAIERADWDRLTDRFTAFFADLGKVEATDAELTFDAGFTGLVVARDGSSRSFMPLHELAATWDRLRFDDEARVVTLEGDGVEYSYRVPPGL